MTPPASSATLTPADFTFSWNCIPDIPLAERFAAVRDAGFRDIGLSIRWMTEFLIDHSLSEVDDLLDEFGLVVTELEAARVMLSDPDPRLVVAATLAEHFHPQRLQATGDFDGTFEDAARYAGVVADQFAEFGTEIVLEPLPFTNMTTPADSVRIIELAGRKNISICMDVWHLYRNQLPLSALDDAWPHISTLQFNDGTIEQEEQDLRDDCLHNRRILGEGEFDLIGLLRERDKRRPDTTFSIEVINTGLRAQDPALTARQIAQGISNVISLLQ